MAQVVCSLLRSNLSYKARVKDFIVRPGHYVIALNLICLLQLGGSIIGAVQLVVFPCINYGARKLKVFETQRKRPTDCAKSG